MSAGSVKIGVWRLAFMVILASVISLSSCITNDIPYPIVELSITNVEGEGFTMSTPDYANRTVIINLDETTDISNVTITGVECTEGAEIVGSIIGTFDMRQPLTVTLSLYQDYQWTIYAEQYVERYFKVEGQIGSEVIDVDNFTALVYVSESVDLTDVTIKELKLGPEGITTMSPSISQITYFETYRRVEVSYHSFVETWRLYVEPTDVVVDITQCDMWARRAYLAAAGDSSGECGFNYRELGASTWLSVAQSDIVTSEGTFSATITDLSPQTTYEFKAYSFDDESTTTTATTEIAMPLTNGDLEEWSKPSTAWLPYLDASTRFWDSGNMGSSAIVNLTTPYYDDLPNSGSTTAAQLKSYNVLVKFAAGNLFVGQFVKVAGTNGIVGFGQPFTQRPTALKGWMKYNCGVIDLVGTVPPGETIVAGQTPDTGIIYAALGTWTPEEFGYSSDGELLGTEQTPIIVDTRSTATFFSPYSSAVISYGELLFTESQSEWVEFTIPLEYNSLSAIPTHLVIVASASRYGDYFTGSTSSTMWLDELELVYE